MNRESVVAVCVSEFIGTLILVFFGVGSVHTAVLAGAQQGLWQVAVVWGVAIALAIYATGAVSGAHINPAITLAFAAFRGFPKWKVAPYILSQVLGAFVGAALLYSLFCGMIVDRETATGLTRGGPGSEAIAMVYGEYFPNPAMIGTTARAFAQVSLPQAMAAEGLGTAFLAFFIFALVDERNRNRPRANLSPLFIGLTVSILISLLAPLTQAGLNPARDFGPRLFSWFAGWGRIAIPGPRGGFFTVYILSPILGALVGGGLYELITRPHLEAQNEPRTQGLASAIGSNGSGISSRLKEKDLDETLNSS